MEKRDESELRQDSGKVCVGIGDGMWLYCKQGSTTRRKL